MRRLRLLRHRLRSVFLPSRVEDELDRELRLHLEALTREAIESGAGRGRGTASRAQGVRLDGSRPRAMSRHPPRRTDRRPRARPALRRPAAAADRRCSRRRRCSRWRSGPRCHDGRSSASRTRCCGACSRSRIRRTWCSSRRRARRASAVRRPIRCSRACARRRQPSPAWRRLPATNSTSRWTARSSRSTARSRPAATSTCSASPRRPDA